jgi:hypothetical protein
MLCEHKTAGALCVATNALKASYNACSVGVGAVAVQKMKWWLKVGRNMRGYPFMVADGKSHATS